jgi:hypothetical protein
VTSKIGSHATWEARNFTVAKNFSATGDSMRTSLPALAKVVDANVRIALYAGDADYMVNFVGVEAMVRVHFPPHCHVAHVPFRRSFSQSFFFALTPPTPFSSLDSLQIGTLSTQFAQLNFANYTVGGALAGVFKNAGTISYARFFGAGQQVSAYPTGGAPRGAATLQMFTQIMSGAKLSGT